MDKESAIRIIDLEGLQGYNLNEDRNDKENEVVIKKNGDAWVVYVTDERASKITNSLDQYSKESDALDDFIERLRGDKILREL